MALEKFRQQFLTRFQDWQSGLQPDEHQRAQSLLSPYLDGQLSPQAVNWLEEHLRVCDATCPRDLESLRATVTILKQLPQVQPPRNFTLTPAAMLARPRPVRPTLQSYLPTATAVSALLLFLLVSADLGLQLFAPPAPAAAPQEGVALEATAPQDREAATPPAIGGEFPLTPEADALKLEPPLSPSPVSPLRTLQGIALVLFLALGFVTAFYAWRPRSP